MSRRPPLIRALVTTGLIAASSVVLGCGGASQDEIGKAKAQGKAEAQAEQKAAAERKRQATLEAKVRRLEAQQKAAAKASSGASTSSTAASGTSCGSGITVATNTSCAFARNVYIEWQYAGGGTVTVAAWSPVTNRYYEITCTAGVTTTCRGGNNAVIYIR